MLLLQAAHELLQYQPVKLVFQVDIFDACVDVRVVVDLDHHRCITGLFDIDAVEGRVSGVIHVADRDGDQLVYQLAGEFDWEAGTVYVDYYTGSWEFTPTRAARDAAGASSGDDVVTFTVFGLSDEVGQFGGVLRIATTGEPTTLDMLVTSAADTREPGKHVFETLFTPDAAGSPAPFLVNTYEWRNGDTLLHLVLRQGILFHNGDEMKSTDVVACLNRWGG